MTDDNKNEGKSAAELEREKINVTGMPKEEDENKEEKELDATKDDDENKDENEENKDNETNEEDKENLEASTDDKKELEKLKKTIERLQKRIGRTVGERDTIKKELVDAKAALESKLAEGEQPLTEEEVNRRANELAKQTVTEREFEAAKTRIAKGAIKADKDFMTKINELAEDIAPIPGAMIGILDDLENENGGAVLAYLANNPDEFEEIHTLPMVKMARRIDKISEKLIEEAKTKPKKISKVPPPTESIGGNAGNSNNSMILTGKESMDEFVRKRNAQVEARRKARLS